MIFVYPFLELTEVTKLFSIKLQKIVTVFQLIWKKHISYLFLNPIWKLFKKILIDLNFDTLILTLFKLIYKHILFYFISLLF